MVFPVAVLETDKNNYSTVQDYQRHLELKVGLYVQEFSICVEALNVISQLVNANPRVYNQGVAWGGINGIAVDGVQGDGFWNQRFMGRNWDMTTGPLDNFKMRPGDLKVVRDAFMVDVCGQVGTVNDTNQVKEAMTREVACSSGKANVLRIANDARTMGFRV